jgi:large subunit ribosomal protein L21
VIKVEKLDGEAGATVNLDQVLMVGDDAAVTVGAPLVNGASVAAEVVDQIKGPKITIFKKRRRKHSRRTRGHRQPITILRVTGITAGA